MTKLLLITTLAILAISVSTVLASEPEPKDEIAPVNLPQICEVRILGEHMISGSRCFIDEVMTGLYQGYVLCGKVMVQCPVPPKPPTNE